jgi:hypothetical protein
MAIMKFDSKLYEEIGIKAANEGFFLEWRTLSSSIKNTEELPLCEAGFKAYQQLKLQGSA